MLSAGLRKMQNLKWPHALKIGGGAQSAPLISNAHLKFSYTAQQILHLVRKKIQIVAGTLLNWRSVENALLLALQQQNRWKTAMQKVGDSQQDIGHDFEYPWLRKLLLQRIWAQGYRTKIRSNATYLKHFSIFSDFCSVFRNIFEIL